MAFNNTETKEIEKIVKKELKSFLDTTDAHNIVIKLIQKEIGSNKMDNKITDLASKVVVELFKTLWTKRSFWETSIKNVR